MKTLYVFKQNKYVKDETMIFFSPRDLAKAQAKQPLLISPMQLQSFPVETELPSLMPLLIRALYTWPWAISMYSAPLVMKVLSLLCLAPPQ